MKKLIAMLLVLVMMLSVAACTATPAETTPSTEAPAPSESEGPKAMTHAEYTAAEEDAPVVVDCYVQGTQSWYNGAVKVYAQDKEGGYFAYDMVCSEEDAAKLVPGTKIRITGFKTFYKGLPEIAAGATFEFLDAADTYVATATDLTDKLGSDELAKDSGMLAAFKGLTITSIEYKNGEPGDDIYVKLSAGDATYNFCVERYLTDPDTAVYKAFAELKVGDVVDVEGFIYWYEGIEPHITSVTKA